jgi:hypothetical protein
MLQLAPIRNARAGRPSSFDCPSVGTVGTHSRTGLIESIVGLSKTECITTSIFHRGPYKTLADVKRASNEEDQLESSGWWPVT